MARKPSGKPNGRPPIEVDWEEFKKLCELRCTTSEICAFMEISSTTLELKCKEKFGESFFEVNKRLGEVGNISLRRSRRRLADRNFRVNTELCARYLGEFPMVYDKLDDKETDQTSLEHLASLMKMLSQNQPQSLLKIDESNKSEEAKS